VDLVLHFDGSKSIERHTFIANYRERKMFSSAQNVIQQDIGAIAQRAKELSDLMPNAKGIFFASAFTGKNISILKGDLFITRASIFESEVNVSQKKRKLKCLRIF
jgi:hypothetical protein